MPPPTTAPTPRALLAIIGGGNMARAIVLGALDAKLLAPFELVVVDPDPAKRAAFASWGVGASASIAEALAALVPPRPRTFAAQHDPFDTASDLAAHGGQVLLAVKPQSLDDVARELGPLLARQERVVISILAGTSTARLRDALGIADLPVVRAMPNTPARLRKGMTALATPASLPGSQAQFAYDLFASLGEVIRIDESLMNAFTALAGSGPAYVFYLAESLLDAAQHVGFDRITADRIVRQTLAGASALLAESHDPPAALRAAVTSKGGTTQAACDTLDARAVRAAIIDAVTAARDRGATLGG
jgi:pyrroline-5-carboxylate reductase